MRTLIGVLALTALAGAAEADTADVDRLIAALRMPEFSDALAAEGLTHGAELEETLFPGKGGPSWDDALKDIYAAEDITGILTAAMHEALDDRDVAEAIAFFEGPTGRKSVELELSARWALLDTDIEDASHETLARMQAAGDPRLDLIRQYSDANALVENNVVGAMNGNFAFLSAMAEAGQGPFAGNTAAILGEVWSQEEEIRDDTTEWVMSYFAFAYGPMSDAELSEMIGFSRTEAGKVLNEAVFAAFDKLFVQLSGELGREAAKFMAGESL